LPASSAPTTPADCDDILHADGVSVGVGRSRSSARRVLLRFARGGEDNNGVTSC
jgi:hypothetical protein